MPTISASSFQGYWTSNECLIVMTRFDPLAVSADTTGFASSPTVPLCVLQLSPQSAKDLFLILKDGVDAYEQNWGPISTEFSRAKLSQPK